MNEQPFQQDPYGNRPDYYAPDYGQSNYPHPMQYNPNGPYSNPGQYPPRPQPKPKKKGSNVMGILGFVFSLLAYLLSFIGGQLIFWPLGLVFSIIGLFKAPRTFAITGFILSIIYIIVFLMVIFLFATVAGSFMSILLPFLTPEFILVLLGILTIE